MKTHQPIEVLWLALRESTHFFLRLCVCPLETEQILEQRAELNMGPESPLFLSDKSTQKGKLKSWDHIS